MLRYFQEGLRPFILAELQNEDLKLENFVQIVKKAVVAEAKANLQPRSTTCNMDQHCLQGSRSANTTAAKASNQGNSQGQLIKDPRVEEAQARSPESLTASHRSNNSESSARARRDKKKDRRRYNQRQRQQKGSTPATGVNTAEPGKANKKKNNDRNRDRNQNQNCSDKTACDVSKARY